MAGKGPSEDTAFKVKIEGYVGCTECPKNSIAAKGSGTCKGTLAGKGLDDFEL